MNRNVTTIGEEKVCMECFIYIAPYDKERIDRTDGTRHPSCDKKHRQQTFQFKGSIAVN